jgi:DNA ligase-1
VSLLRIEFKAGNLHLPELGLWLDPHEPELGPERVFVSHAHSDHTAAHREVILSEPSARLMQARVPGKRLEHTLAFGEKRRFDFGPHSYDITLTPAGHIFGSAMSLIEVGGQSLLYTGDFKLKPGLSAETCEPRPADILVMETTYGRPHYVFPPSKEVIEGIIRFCREALDNDETAVLLGYSLGKSQEILCGLGEAGMPLMLHGTVYRLTQIYEQFGQCFPKYERYDAGSARGKVLLCPPNVANSAMLRKLGKIRSAILTGWAVDPNARFRYQCDAAFPLSDHADFPDLIELVKRVQPKKVYTLHGFAAEFAQTLRDLGYDATALSEDEQLTLAMGGAGAKKVRAVNREAIPASQKLQQHPEAASGPGPSDDSKNRFIAFAEACGRIAADSSKLEKIRQVAEYLRTLDGEAVALAATWFSGRPFPANQNKVLQLGWAVLRDALCAVGKVDEAALHQIYLKHSDVGETAAEVLKDRDIAPNLSLEEVDGMFHAIHAARGPLAKTPLLMRALERCTALEAKYLVKIITGDLRIGLKEGLVEDAVASAFGKPAAEVRQANLLVGDIGATAKLAAANRLSEASLVPFRPVKFMLASPEETAEDIRKRVEEWTAEESSPANLPPPTNDPKTQPAAEVQSNADGSLSQERPLLVWLEDKYDGIRCQLHKVGTRVALYSRDLKDITTTFLELADSIRNAEGDFILDGEVVAMRGEQILPFAELQKRLGRRDGDLFMREEVPIQYVAFDLLWHNGQSQLNRPLRDRRRQLETICNECLGLARFTEAKSVAEIEEAFVAARARGNEGLMIKDPASIYAPGRRGLSWLKLKKALATLDCVVVGAEYGHGKRSKVLSDYTFAVRDETTGELKTIGKAYSGLTDAEIAQLTEHFLKHAKRQRGRYFEVEPNIVLEIAFDKIQESDRHNSGLAMRFPRIARIRTDKPVSEIDTVASARKLVERKRLDAESK